MKKSVLILSILSLAGAFFLRADRLPVDRSPQMAPAAPAAPVPTYNGPRNQFLNGTIFEDVTTASGFDHQGHGKCIAMGDYDKDGDLDIYISVVYSKNKLFQNDGQFRFKDMAPTLAVDCPLDTHGIALADFDNNGYLDIFCANNVEALSLMRGRVLQPNAFYLGFDEGFVELASRARLAGIDYNFSCGVTTADVNNDGLLDIFVAKGAYRKGPDCANSLYVNNGDGTYRDIAKEAGVADQGNGYCCAFGDYDNDGHPDLYVGNINDTDQPVTRILYHNNGNGTFADVTKKLGLAARGNNISCFWLDIDNDGDLDLYLANSSGPGHLEPEWGADSLFRNNGDATFTDISKESGVALLTNSRGSTMGDIDNDGDLDILVNNSWDDTNVYLNDGRGHFTDAHKTTGGSVFYGHGCALGDLDNDGDLDLAMGNWRRPSAENPGLWRLFRNKTGGRNYLKVDLAGTKSNRSAVMSKIWVYDAGHSGEPKFLRGFRQVTAGNGTFPGNPLQAHFGLDAAKKYDILVRFPSGGEAVLRDAAAAQTVRVVEPDKL
jgi:enediyne biosynthesis protein E4